MDADFHGEEHRQISSGWLRAGIFGVSDGLVTNTSLILGFAGANPGHNVVRLAGLAGLVAGAFSMASGEYVSMRAQKEILEYEIGVESRSLLDHPAEETEELRNIFLKQGIEPDLAERLSVDLMSDHKLAVRTHAREELGIDPSATGSPWAAAGSSMLAFAVGGPDSAVAVGRDVSRQRRAGVDHLGDNYGVRGWWHHWMVHPQRRYPLGNPSGVDWWSRRVRDLRHRSPGGRWLSVTEAN
jgi:hypothetical protein